MVNRFRIVGLLLFVCLCGVAIAEDAPATEPSTQPAMIVPTDTDALVAAKDQFVTVEGVVHKASWATSGKIFFVNFNDVDKAKGLQCVAFAKNKEKLDAAFDGDVAAKLTGAKIQITGKVEIFKEHPEIVILGPEQVKILEPAPAK